MTPDIQAPRGTQDILPDEQPWWDYVRDTAERLCGEFRYAQIDTPMFECSETWVLAILNSSPW